jgi:hypothetical protein
MHSQRTVSSCRETPRTDEERRSLSTDRRGFLKLAGTAAAGVAVASWAVPASAQFIERKGKGIMKTRRLGDLEVSELGFGDMGLSGGHYGPGVDKAQGIRVIRDAHERGVTFFRHCGSVWSLCQRGTGRRGPLASSQQSGHRHEVWLQDRRHKWVGQSARAHLTCCRRIAQAPKN